MDEYISREATVQKIKQIGAENYSGMYANIGMTHAAQIVKFMPAADVAPVVHGRWVAEENESISKRNRLIKYKTYYCSMCGRGNGRNMGKYCPHCGARMDEKDGEPNETKK